VSRGKQVFVRMNPDDYALLEAEAERTGKSDAALLRDAFLGTARHGGQPPWRPVSEAATRKDDPVAEVFLCETGQLTDESRQALREAGIVAVEVRDPSKCRFIRSGETVSSTDMLWAAMNALGRDFGAYSKGEKQREQFALNVAQLIEAAHKAQERAALLPGSDRA
jgi:hypothetical protein